MVAMALTELTVSMDRLTSFMMAEEADLTSTDEGRVLNETGKKKAPTSPRGSKGGAHHSARHP